MSRIHSSFSCPGPGPTSPTAPCTWWWSLSALALAIGLLSIVGRMARNYIVKKMIEGVDLALLRVPIFNKIYPAIKQVNDAFSSSNKGSFKQVVLVEFPRQGVYSIGFLTGSQPGEVRRKLNQDLVNVFVPTTPNPTGGFVLLVPERQVTRLQMSVADGVKFILSLGSVAPEFVSGAPPVETAAQEDLVPPPPAASLPARG